MNEYQKMKLQLGVSVAVVALAIGGLFLWVSTERPDYRIVARDEPDGFTRYVVESHILGSCYRRCWEMTSFSLPDAKAKVTRLMENDKRARELKLAKWRVVE